uniref:Uncharacterized protein n=1 Tax=Romanomermis culicivorax TaxID=13658 RepID=A0A915J5J2_ROMCU
MPYYAYICPDIACGHMMVSEENIHESQVVLCSLCGREFFRKYFGFLRVERKFFREVEKRNEHTKYRHCKSFIRINGVSELLCKSLSQTITQYEISHDCQSTHCPWSVFQTSIHPCGMGLLNAVIDCSRYGIAAAACKVVVEIRRSIAKSTGRPMNALIPVDVPTGEYSLLYSISRVLCGRTVLWHPLITAMHEHLKTNLKKSGQIIRRLKRYQAKFQHSRPVDQWSEVLEACDPLNVQELSRIHIYIMCNALCRPIILFSSINDCPTELSCTFLPSLMELECYDRDRVGSPIVLSWMDGNFFDIVLWLSLKGRSLQKIPVYLLPPVYYDECGVENYMEIENGCCTPYKGCTEFK